MRAQPRHALAHDARQPYRFVGKIPAIGVGTGSFVAAKAEGSIDGLEHGLESLRQLARRRNLKGNARIVVPVPGSSSGAPPPA